MEKIRIRRRIYGTLTPEQLKRLKKARKLIAKELPDLVRRNQLRHDARKERTFSGVLRRAIHDYPLNPWTIAEKVGLTSIELDDFLTGQKTLPSDAIDRLVQLLKIKLPPVKVKRTRPAKAG